jgi:ABC-type glycerol-3-phosphate transport system permease component
MTVTTDLTPRNAPNQMRRPARLALHAILILGTALMVTPFLLMLLVSLLPLNAFLQRDFRLRIADAGQLLARPSRPCPLAAITSTASSVQ